MGLSEIKSNLKEAANPEHAKILQKFFKAGKGEYGEGDIFIGIKVPVIRKIVRGNNQITLLETKKLLESIIHEERLTALLILVKKYSNGDYRDKEEIFKLYLNNRVYINNWDLVDLSAPNIVGNFLLDKDKSILYELAKSKNLWDKRISIISTFTFIRANLFDTTLNLAEILLNDKHDLIHKAAGWMLREIGKRNIETEQSFLKLHYKNMPRTMLRYSIEKFPEKLRQDYLKGRI